MSDKKPLFHPICSQISREDYQVFVMDHAYSVMGPEIIRCGNLDPVAVIQDRKKQEFKFFT